LSTLAKQKGLKGTIPYKEHIIMSVMSLAGPFEIFNVNESISLSEKNTQREKI